jgi:hypothetical protein
MDSGSVRRGQYPQRSWPAGQRRKTWHRRPNPTGASHFRHLTVPSGSGQTTAGMPVPPPEPPCIHTWLARGHATFSRRVRLDRGSARRPVPWGPGALRHPRRRGSRLAISRQGRLAAAVLPQVRDTFALQTPSTTPWAWRASTVPEVRDTFALQTPSTTPWAWRASTVLLASRTVRSRCGVRNPRRDRGSPTFPGTDTHHERRVKHGAFLACRDRPPWKPGSPHPGRGIRRCRVPRAGGRASGSCEARRLASAAADGYARAPVGGDVFPARRGRATAAPGGARGTPGPAVSRDRPGRDARPGAIWQPGLGHVCCCTAATSRPLCGGLCTPSCIVQAGRTEA